MERMALARLRQLSAHEVGHTIGLAHNYIASSAGRASVMDYPHPYAQLRGDGSIDLSDAYATGIGEWDKVAIEFGYREYPPDVDADTQSRHVLLNAMQNGIFFLTDQDARPAGSAHPQTHLWDNGKNAIDELDRVMEIRGAALRRFGEAVIPEGQPLATLEEALVPLYLGHRYQAEAATKVIAGAVYTYAIRGDGQIPYEIVPGKEQRRALDAVLRTVSPDALVLPERVAQLIPPRPFGYWSHRELFASGTSPMFDRLAPARAATHHVMALLFNTQRANRLAQQHAVNRELPGVEEVLRTIVDKVWHQKGSEDMAGEVRQEVQSVMLE